MENTVYADGAFVLFGNDAAMFSDMYKSAYGCRPLFENIYYSIESVDKEFALLQRQCEAVWDEEEKASQAGFQRLVSRMDELVAMGAGTPRNALRWLLQSIGEKYMDDYSVGFLLYHFGISTYTDSIKKLQAIVGRF